MRISTLTLAITLMFVFASSLISCQKEPIAVSQPAIPPLQQTLAVLQASFAAQHLDQKLVEQLKNSTELHWQPNWLAITQQKVNDSVSFFYVPLHPAIKMSGSDKLKFSGRLAASKQYLLVKQALIGEKSSFKFFSARYIFQLQPSARVDPTQRTNPFNSFNGTVLIHGLLNDERRRLAYVNGILVLPAVKQQVGSAKTGAHTNATQCDDYWTCLWQCDNMGYPVYATTSGLND